LAVKLFELKVMLHGEASLQSSSRAPALPEEAELLKKLDFSMKRELTSAYKQPIEGAELLRNFELVKLKEETEPQLFRLEMLMPEFSVVALLCRIVVSSKEACLKLRTLRAVAVGAVPLSMTVLESLMELTPEK